MKSPFRRPLLLLLPVLALTLWGFLLGQPSPPVPPDAPHISAAIEEKITRRLSGRSWVSPVGEKFVFLKFEVTHARMSNDRKRVFMRTDLSCDEFIPGQIPPSQFSDIRQAIFHRDGNGVYSGDIKISDYGIIRVDVETAKSN